MQSLQLTISEPGPDRSRQLASHPHEVLVDPTGSYLVVPDLGADLVRVFSISASTGSLTESIPLKVMPGSGPRHGTFLVSNYNTFFFLISELGNKITSYKVTYGTNILKFREVFDSGIYGNATTPTGAAAAEAILSVSLFALPRLDKD